jgi:copper homeostasis protein (lipoprotein)
MKKLVYILFFLVLAACNGNTGNKIETANKTISSGKEALGVFTGVLPCADCEGIETTITLKENKEKNERTYALKEVYLGQGSDKPFETKGKWTIIKGTPTDPNAIVYQLAIENDDPEDLDIVNYQVVNNNTLNLLDDEMNEFDSKSNYSLKRK